jgi:uncharacterized protein YecE (DUF72 family)
MARKKGNLHIGTSGWSYKHWLGKFYPEALRAAEQFDYYLMFFDTVEINNSFYRLPKREIFLKWNTETFPGFQFSVKASRYITHMKKLHDADQALDIFMANATALEEKLGTILFQLPPGWKVNLERLHTFLEALPRDVRFVFEFRDPSWYTEEVYALLRAYHCAFCIYELAGHGSPMEITADFIYIRLHGPGGKYQGSYSDSILTEWANRLLKWQDEGKDVYIYFDNDENAYAVFNALTLKDLVNAS